MAPGELGRVIGRQGRTAAAVRTLAAAAGELDGHRVDGRFPRRVDARSDWAVDGHRRPRSSGRTASGPGRRRARDGLSAPSDFAVGAALHGPASAAVVGPLVVASSRRARRPLGRRVRRRRDDRTTPRRCADVELRIPRRGAAAALGPGRYYVHDLAGCEVVTVAGRVVGRVDRVDLGTGTPLLVVDGARGEVLVPLADAICRRVDVAAKVDRDRSAGRAARARMTVDVITIFPAMVEAALAEGVVGRARERGLVDIRVRDLRDVHRRPAPDGRRRAVRRRAGHGDEARAAVSRGRGDRGRARDAVGGRADDAAGPPLHARRGASG